jgi:hypothetical protein
MNFLTVVHPFNLVLAALCLAPATALVWQLATYPMFREWSRRRVLTVATICFEVCVAVMEMGMALGRW